MSWEPIHADHAIENVCAIFSYRTDIDENTFDELVVSGRRYVKSLKDSDGNNYGLELYAAGQKPEGEITEIKNYKFPKPGTTERMFSKISFVTKVSELACGVGYYK